MQPALQTDDLHVLLNEKNLVFSDSDKNLAVRMQAFKTVETQVPFLKESFFTATFKGRRKSSVTNILRKQQQSLLNQHQQQLQLQQESISEHPGHLAPPSVENGPGQCTLQHQRRIRSTSIPLCKTAERAGADGERKAGPAERKDQRATEAAQWRLGGQGASGCESVAVSASPCPSSAAQEPGAAAATAKAAASLPQLQASSSAGKKQPAGGWERAPHSQDAAQHAQPRPQQHGLLAKGVRLLRNMGNQEAKQKKGGGTAAGDVSCEGEADEREVDKKSKKSHSRSSKGEQKKKSKSESKGSVFSGMKIRKSLSRARGLSKEDILEDGKGGMRSAADGGLSADEMLSDGEGDPSRLADDCQSAADDLDRKLSSGSDGDLYSFHSAAAESEDLLLDIQQAMREQSVPGRFSKELLSEEHKAPHMMVSASSSNRPEKKRPPPPPPSAEIEHLQQEAGVESKQLENQSCGLGSRGSSAAGSPSESAPDTDRSSVSLLPKTNSTYSFPDTNTTTNTSYESAEEPQDEPESPVLRLLHSQTPCVPLVLLEPVVVPPSPPMGPHKSVSSMDLSTQEQEEEAGRRDFLSLKRRKSSLSISLLSADPAGPPSRRTSSSSASTVKLYPPIHPSYVKTTTRQLTSPLSSPITSPHVPRKTNGAAPAEATGGAPFRKPKKRSCSIGGPISLSADWPSEPESPEKSSSSGGTYWTLGSRRVHQQRQSSPDTSAFLDVFSGESLEVN